MESSDKPVRDDFDSDEQLDYENKDKHQDERLKK